jgi:hypothetical protein
MNQISPHQLWLGNADDARDFRGLFAVGIRALVQVAMEEPPDQPPREFIYCRFPLLDGPGNGVPLLGLAIHSVMGLLNQGLPTLLYCRIGMSRSPAIAAAVLAMIHGDSPQKWLQRVAEYRSTDVSPGLWAEIIELPELARGEKS